MVKKSWKEIATESGRYLRHSNIKRTAVFRSSSSKKECAYAMTNQRYHYVQWHICNQKTEQAGEQVTVELYDHQVDSDENFNVASQPGYVERVKQLARQLKAGWEAARPPS